MESLFKVQVEREVLGKTMRPWRLNQLSLGVDHRKGEPGTGFAGVADIEAFEQGQPSPGNEAIGSVPGIRSGDLRADGQIIEGIVEHLVGSRTGASVRGGNDVALAECAAQVNLESVIAVAASILQKETRAVRVGAGVVHESIRAIPLKEFRFQENLRRKLSL